MLNHKEKTTVYITTIYFLAVVYLAFISREPMPYIKYSIDLFKAAQRGLEFEGGVLSGILCGDVRVTSWQSLKGMLLNILLFVPFGYLLPSLFPSKRWWQVILLGLVFSLTIELLQLITRLGYADVDDLINNTLGAAIGFLSYKLFLNSHVPLR